MKLKVLLVVWVVAFAIVGIANAGLVTVNHNNLLPSSGTENIDLEFDGILDIGMAERYYGEDRAWLYLDSVSQPTAMSLGFVSAGTFIDASTSWLTSSYQEPVMSIGNNYLGIFNASAGSFYGYATINYDGVNMVLASYTYDDTGSGISVIPEPASAGLMAVFGGAGWCIRRKFRG